MAHELDTRMRAVETGQARLETTIVDNIALTSKLLTKYGDTIYGTDETPGLSVRLDREEQNTARQKKTFWIFCASLIGIVGKFIYDGVAFLFNHPH